MLAFLTKYKLIVYGILIVIILGYIGYLKYENMSLENTISKQKTEIVKLTNERDKAIESLSNCENGVAGLKLQIERQYESSKKALDNCSKINSTLSNAINVSKESVKGGVMSDEKSNEVIDLYNNIFSRYYK